MSFCLIVSSTLPSSNNHYNHYGQNLVSLMKCPCMEGCLGRLIGTELVDRQSDVFRLMLLTKRWFFLFHGFYIALSYNGLTVDTIYFSGFDSVEDLSMSSCASSHHSGDPPLLWCSCSRNLLYRIKKATVWKISYEQNSLTVFSCLQYFSSLMTIHLVLSS